MIFETAMPASVLASGKLTLKGVSVCLQVLA